MYEYLLVTGAPGSRWSGVANGVYQSPDVNSSDYKKKNTYYFDEEDIDDPDIRPNHQGTYFGMGQEYGTKKEDWDIPFKKKKGLKIIKSHDFAYQLNHLKSFKQPILLVYRPPIDCYDWWHEAGGWKIKYPNYLHYHDDDYLFLEIENQCNEIQRFIHQERKHIMRVDNLYDLCYNIGIKTPKNVYSITGGSHWHYEEKDTKVYLWTYD